MFLREISSFPFISTNSKDHLMEKGILNPGIKAPTRTNKYPASGQLPASAKNTFPSLEGLRLVGMLSKMQTMSGIALRVMLGAVILFATAQQSIAQGGASFTDTDTANKAALLEKYTKAAQPILFMENRGQITDQHGNLRKDILFMAKSQGFKVAVKGNGLSYQFDKRSGEVAMSEHRNMELDPTKMDELGSELETYRVDMTLINANPNPQVERLSKNAYTENYYNLPHAPEGLLGVAAYEKIILKEVYPGIDWVVYTHQSGLKYDFIVHPGADPAQIKMSYAGSNTMALQPDGSLKVTTPLGELTEDVPITFSGKNQVNSRFVLKDGVLSFDVPDYDPTQTLTIDPTLVWATYYGGPATDWAFWVAVDGLDNVYMAGITSSSTAIASGGHDNTLDGAWDAFLVKFNSAGVRQWATYYGGTGDDFGFRPAIDGSNNVYVGGYTNSTSGIATTGQTTIGGLNDAYLVKFDPLGVRQWGTYYGGSAYDRGLFVKAAGSDVFLSGLTNSTTNIATGGAHQTTYGGGEDGFLAKFNASGALQWGTYYGGAGYDNAVAVYQSDDGNLYLLGITTSTTNIATAGAYQPTHGGPGGLDLFFIKFNASGTRQWGTYYGGSGTDHACGDIVSACNSLYITAFTANSSGLATAGAYQTTNAGGEDGLFLEFDVSGGLRYATYYGGPGEDLLYGTASSTDNSQIYLSGHTQSTSGIATPGAHQTTHGGDVDAFLVKFSIDPLVSTATAGGPNNVCQSATPAAITLSGASVGGGATTGAWSIVSGGGTLSSTAQTANPELVTYTPAPNYAGPVTLRLTTNEGNCVAATDDRMITITDQLLAGSDGSDEFCKGTGDNYSLVALLSGADAGGTWAQTGGMTTVVISDPSSVDFSAAVPDTYIFTYTHAANGSCPEDQAVITITVNPLPVVTLNDPADVCVNGADMNFTGTPANGVYTSTAGAALTDNGDGTAVLDVSAAGAGTYTVTYTYTDGNGCEASQTVSVTVFPLPVVNAGSYGPVCEDAADIVLFGMPTGGVWTGTGVSGNQTDGYVFDPSVGTQTLTYTFTDGNSCSAFQTVSVTVFDAAEASASATPSTCVGNTAQNNGSIQLTAVPVGTHFHWSVGTTFDDSGGTNTYANATPVTGPFPQTVAMGLANPSGYQIYTIRVYNSSDDCYIDLIVVLTESKCCPTGNCGGVQVQINNN